MVKLLRVDHRLLHGQVAFSWCNALDIDAILIANDDIQNDQIRKMAVRLAKPNNVKLVMKGVKDSINTINSGITDKYNLMVIVENVLDAVAIVQACPDIKSINLGGVPKSDERKKISNAVFLSDDEIGLLKQCELKGIEVEIRQIATDRKQGIQ